MFNSLRMSLVFVLLTAFLSSANRTISTVHLNFISCRNLQRRLLFTDAEDNRTKCGRCPLYLYFNVADSYTILKLVFDTTVITMISGKRFQESTYYSIVRYTRSVLRNNKEIKLFKKS